MLIQDVLLQDFISRLRLFENANSGARLSLSSFFDIHPDRLIIEVFEQVRDKMLQEDFNGLVELEIQLRRGHV